MTAGVVDHTNPEATGWHNVYRADDKIDVRERHRLNKEISSAWRELMQREPQRASSTTSATWAPIAIHGTVGAPPAVIEAMRKLTTGMFAPATGFRTESAQGIDPYVKRLDDELRSFILLGEDWDAQGAEAISVEACEQARRFVTSLPPQFHRFEAYPEPNGNVGLEYHKNGTVSLYLSISGTGEITYVAITRDRTKGEEIHRGHGVRFKAGSHSVFEQILYALG
jgi:hypothetical protein